MSGIKSTSGGTPTPPVDTAKGAATAQQQVAPIAPSSAPGGHSGPAIPQASSISQLTEGATIAAIVIARATGGDTMLHAEIGNFRMSASSQLPVGSHVILEIEAMDDVIIARIIALNGEKLAAPPSVTLLPTVNPKGPPLDGYGGGAKIVPADIKTGLQNLTTTLGKAVNAEPNTANAAGTRPATATPTPTLSTAQTTPPIAPGKYGNTSVPIPSIGLQGSVSAAKQTPQSGTAAYAHTNSPGPKIIPTIPSSAASADTAAAKTNVAGAPTIPGQSGEQPTLIKATIQRPPLSQTVDLPSGPKNVQQGSTLTLIASSTSGKENITLPQGKSAIGTIIGLSGAPKAANGVILSTVHVQTTAFGTISYSTASPPQVGSHLNFTALDELQSFPLTQAPLGSNTFKTPHLPIMTEWENLRSALNTLLAQDPAQALSLLNARIPSPNTQLGASLLFFLSALNGGSLDKWLGQDFRQILENAGQQRLLANLDDDFATLARISSDTGGNDWKNLTFPFFDGQALRQIKMFYRQRNKSSDEDGEDSTRFVIELDLSKSGPVQLDGLFNKSRFDLVFRSQLPLSEDIRQRIHTIFADNLEITGIKGSLVFQRSIPFPVHPTEEWENTGHDILKA